ncbi:MAG TPA: hypothetical protein VHD37_00665 [Candidatus Paceibacterota bacterium]|nr:hypothetical protein [Candidatus Paceibacterota bacterium]
MRTRWLPIGVVFVALVASGVFFGPGLGGKNEQPTQALKHYDGAEVAFDYPALYALQTHADSYAGKPVAALTLIDAGIAVPDMSEGPPGIAVLMVSQGTTTDIGQWVRGNSISNFGGLSMDYTLAPAAVGGEPAVSYRYSGLYETDAYAVARNGTVYLFFGSWSGESDQIRTDFKNLVNSVTFK